MSTRKYGFLGILLGVILIAVHVYALDLNWQNLFFLSASVVTVSLGLIYLPSQSVAIKTIALAMFCTVLILVLVYFVAHYFTGEGINYDVTTHFSLDSIEAGFYGLASYHIWVIVLLLTMLAMAGALVKFGQKKYNGARTSVHTIGLIAIAIFLHPGSHDLAQIQLTYASSQQDPELLASYKSGFLSDDTIRDLDIDAKSLPDVLVIYLESFEQSYLDPNLFPDLAPNTRQLVADGESFSNYSQLWGGSHTIAGMVTSMCGVPYTTLSGIVYQSGGGDFFMPGVQCLGDVTKELGYRNLFYQGARLSFSRKGAFFRAHGYEEVVGFNEQGGINNDEADFAQWGLHDDFVFKNAMQRISELKQDKNRDPFLFTMLTLDAHDPFSKGYISKWCVENGHHKYSEEHRDNRIQNAIYCTDRLLNRFVSELKKKWGNSLDIFIVTDHLAPKHSTGKKLRSLETKERKLIFSHVNSGNPHVNSRSFSQLDIGSSILGHITNGKIEKLGMGVSVYSKSQNLSERFGFSDLNEKVEQSIRSFGKMFWKYPSFAENPIEIFVRDQLVKVGEDTFPYPLSLLLDNDGDIVDFHSGNIQYQFQLVKQSPRMVWIDRCFLVQKYVEVKIGDKGYCLFIGNIGAKNNLVSKVSDDIVLSYNELSDWFNQEVNYDLLNNRLYDRNQYEVPGGVSGSSGSIEVDPMGKVLFVASVNANTNMVSTYRNPVVYDRTLKFQNFKSAAHNGLFLFGLSNGRVELIKSWRDCGRTRENERIDPLLRSSKFDEFVLATGRNGKCRPELAKLFGDSVFSDDVRALKQSQPFIGYFNRKTGKYDSVIGNVGGEAIFTLVNSKIYNKKFY